MAFNQITWTGSSNSLWNFSDLNWSTGSQKYADAGQAVFTDTGSVTAIALTAAVNPQAGVVFNNTSGGRTYSITNAGGSIGGPGGITLNGTGTVSLDVGYPDPGPTVINAGTLNVKNDTSIGTVPAAATPNSLVIADGATFGNNIPAVVGAPGSFTVSAKRGLAVGGGVNGGATISVVKNGAINNVITYGGIIAYIAGQTGVLNKSGDGELDLTSANTLPGGLNVNGGAVKLTNAAAAGTGPVAVNSGGTLSLGAGIGTP